MAAVIFILLPWLQQHKQTKCSWMNVTLPVLRGGRYTVKLKQLKSHLHRLLPRPSKVLEMVSHGHV